MPHFYFHLATPAGREVDEIGMSCPTAEHALLEGWQAAFEISGDLHQRRLSPLGYRFEVADRDGAPVFELPFSELMSGRTLRPSIPQDVLRTRVAETIERSRALQAEVAAAVAGVRQTLTQTRAILAARSVPGLD